MRAVGWIFLFSCAFSVAHGLKCYQCDTNNKSCLDLQGVPATACSSDDNLGCLTKYDNGKISRECTKRIEDCKEPACFHCNGDACNNHVVCKKCDSKTISTCSSNTEGISSELCDIGYKCLVQVNNEKLTERKCAPSKDFKCPEDKTCKVCDGSNCNSAVFPEDRLICYQCKECNDITNQKGSACTLYDTEDKCFTYGETEETMTRGCLSDKNQVCIDEATKGKCYSCDGNNCNTISYKQDPKLKCIQCDDTDSKCVSGYKPEDAKVCENKFEYWKTEECYVAKIADGKVKRGCVQDRKESEKACTKENSCTTCDKDGCNNAEIIENYTCVRCRSSNENEGSCSKTAEGMKRESCRNEITSKDDIGCFTDRYNGLVIRGCIVDYDKQRAAKCKDPNFKDCDFCNDANDCNDKKAPNSAAILSLTTGFFSISLIVMLFH